MTALVMITSVAFRSRGIRISVRELITLNEILRILLNSCRKFSGIVSKLGIIIIIIIIIITTIRTHRETIIHTFRCKMLCTSVCLG